MESPVHQIDPNGDTLLTLGDIPSPSSFAKCSGGELWPVSSGQTYQFGFNRPTIVTRPVASSLFSTPLPCSSAPTPTPSDRPSPAVIPPPTEIRMRLSSKHLVLASKYFCKMMANEWKETEAGEKSDYTYTVSATGWDPDALLILMRVIHGRTKDVPRVVSLELLAKIAVLVDYYDCHETVALFSETWIRNLAGGLPKEYCRELVLRLFVSWVFGDGAAFQTLTKTVVCQSREPLYQLALPLPGSLVDEIDRKRQAIISDVLADLERTRMSLYPSSAMPFSSEPAGALGIIMMGMHAGSLIDPRPLPPFCGYSVSAVLETMEKMAKPSGTNTLFHSSNASTPNAMAARLIEGVLSKHSGRARGLELRSKSKTTAMTA